MNKTEAVAHAQRIAQLRISTTALADVMQDEAVAALSTEAQQQVLAIVRERIEPRAMARSRAVESEG